MKTRCTETLPIAKRPDTGKTQTEGNRSSKGPPEARGPGKVSEGGGIPRKLPLGGGGENALQTGSEVSTWGGIEATMT